MTATLRLPDPRQPDPELLVLGTSAGSLLCGGTWLFAGLPLPPCAFHLITGCPCPTCGATRCVISLVHGRFADAFAWNPMVFTALAALVLVNFYSLAVLAARLPRFRLSFSPADARILRAAFLMVVAANWAYEIHHRV